MPLNDTEAVSLQTAIKKVAADFPEATQVEILSFALEEANLQGRVTLNTYEACLWWKRTYGVSRTAKASTATVLGNGIKHTAPPKELSPLDRIKAAEQEIRQAMLQLDEERNALQRRIIEIDNLQARYKKQIGQ